MASTFKSIHTLYECMCFRGHLSPLSFPKIVTITLLSPIITCDFLLKLQQGQLYVPMCCFTVPLAFFLHMNPAFSPLSYNVLPKKINFSLQNTKTRILLAKSNLHYATQIVNMPGNTYNKDSYGGHTSIYTFTRPKVSECTCNTRTELIEKTKQAKTK